MAGSTLEIPLSLHRAIVLARCIPEHDTHPVPGREVGRADVVDGGYAAVGQLDGLADFELVDLAHGVR